MWVKPLKECDIEQVTTQTTEVYCIFSVKYWGWDFLWVFHPGSVISMPIGDTRINCQECNLLVGDV
jgi:hypothetical protein